MQIQVIISFTQKYKFNFFYSIINTRESFLQLLHTLYLDAAVYE